MSLTAEEIASQPDCWRLAATLATESDLLLPHPGEHVAALGCGTSWFIAQAYAARRAELALANGVTDPFTPTELPPARWFERSVVISRSGTTTEAIDVVKRFQLEAIKTSVITAVAEASLVAEPRRCAVVTVSTSKARL